MLDLTQLQKKPDGANANPHIFDVSTIDFEERVLRASLQKPVIIEFWAPWCGPCKQLMPLLEEQVQKANGAVLMAKVNIDQNPDLAQALRVQSVPMVYAFFQGQPVDGFLGVRPASEIATFVQKLVTLAGGAAQNDDDAAPIIDKEAFAKLLTKAQDDFKEGKLDDAMADFSNALDIDPQSMEAMAGLCWCLFAQKDMESVREVLSQLDDAQKDSAPIKGLLKILSFADTAQDLPAAKDGSAQAFYNQGLQALARADIENAIDVLVDSVRIAREWNDGAARALLLEVFDALGNTHPLTAQGRRRLSSVLFS